VARWLSEAWFDQTRSMADALPRRPGPSARVQCELTGGPDGEVHTYWVLEGGRLVASGVGDVATADPVGPAEETADAPAEVTVTLSWDDAVAVQQGALDPNVAFMRGRLKVAGSMGVMLHLLAATATPAYQELRQKVLDITEF